MKTNGSSEPPSTLDGDGPCAECDKDENIVWFTDSPLWNNTVRLDGQHIERWGGDPILCLPCFVMVVESSGYAPTGWRVLPEWPIRRDQS